MDRLGRKGQGRAGPLDDTKKPEQHILPDHLELGEVLGLEPAVDLDVER